MLETRETRGRGGNHEGSRSREGLEAISDHVSMPRSGQNVQRAVVVIEPYELSRFQFEAEEKAFWMRSMKEIIMAG